ncbi:DUF2339 domain-containing protein [Desulfococcaceae bacterium OttesenSCG-928-F15]|nr:DUF2339 domain-containing protein [Desulfococcaceae bacterium OttesenSCG-928-F15]
MLKVTLTLLIIIPLFVPYQGLRFVIPVMALAALFLLGRVEALEKESEKRKEAEKRRESWTQTATKPEKEPFQSHAPASYAESIKKEPEIKEERKAAPVPEPLTLSEDQASLLSQAKEERTAASGLRFGAEEIPAAEQEIPKPSEKENPPELRGENTPLSPIKKIPVFRQAAFAEVFMQKAWDWIKNGNPVVKVGLVVFLFGVSFLLKYAVQNFYFPPELRVALAGLFGIILLGIGWRLRIKNRTFALLMQGGGIATLYLTTFAAAKPDTFPIGLNMISPEFGLVIMTALVVFSAILAILQNALWVAIFGWAGGFMAPILLSTGTNRYIALFSYYALLNAGLLGVAWFKSWRYLNLLGFFFTFGVGSLWGIQYYKPEFFTTTEPFLVLFFLMYAVISILFAKSGADKKQARLDSVLVFGLPLVVFGLQMGLVHEMEMGGAYSCLVLSAWYLGTAKFLWKKKEFLQILTESHIGLGIIFVSLAVPMAFDATATASTWALEGAGMVWLGLRQKRIFSRLFGILLQVGAAISFLLVLEENGGNVLQLGQLLAGIFLAIGGLVSSWTYWTYKENSRAEEKTMDLVCGICGLLFWYLVWPDWLHQLKTSYSHSLILAVFTLSHLAWVGLRKKTAWPIPGYALQGFLFLLFVTALAWPKHPAANGGWLIWPLGLGLHFAVLRFHEKEWKSQFVEILHTGSLLLLAILLMWESWWITDFFVHTGIWAHTAPALTGGLLLFAVSSQPKILAWPLKVHERAYMHGGAAIGITLILWWFLACFRAGGQEPLPYVPVLNVLDLGQALIIVLITSWTLKAQKIQLFRLHELKKYFTAGVSAAIFVWFNVVVTRIAHFWGGIPYKAGALFQSSGLQATYAVLWTFMALLAMFYSHRRMRRELWFVGAGLLALVVIKLFLVDLTGRGTLAGIASFLGVGILMLIVGYLCPLPPRQAVRENKAGA